MGGRGRGRGLVDEHYVTLGGDVPSSIRQRYKGVGGVNFPRGGKKRYATLERPLSCTSGWGVGDQSVISLL